MKKVSLADPSHGTALSRNFVNKQSRRRWGLGMTASLLASLSSPLWALNPGDLMFTSMNSDEDGMAMVALVEIPANTTVYFTDNEWDGTAFNGGEGYWQWVSGAAAIPVGTVVRMLSVDLTSLSASHGTLTRATVAGSASYGFSGTEDSLYAYQATAVNAAPTSFLSAICNTSFGTAGAGFLTNTGLSIGNGAIQAAVSSGSDFFEYSGSRNNQTTFAAYLGVVSNIANWTVDTTNGAYATSVPNTTAFILRPPLPKISLAVSPGSGKETAGTVITATVTASSAVVGDQTVGITVTGNGITATDYSLSPAVVTILNGATTGTATFTILNDADIEGTETATLTLASPSAGIDLGTAITGNVQILENQPPVVRGSIPTLFAYPDETAASTFSPLIFSDPDNDPLTYSATLTDGSPLPAWITFNPATRQISATPTVSEVGTVNLKVSATDIGLPPQTASVFFGVQVLPASTTVSVNATGMAGLTIPAECSPTALVPLISPSPAGGRFSGAGTQGNTFDPALAQIGLNVVTYSVGSRSTTFNVTVTASPTVATLPTNKLFSTLKSSIVLSEDGTAATPGGAEIPAFDSASKRVFSASNAGIQVMDFTNPSAPVRLAPIDPTTLGFTSKDISHVIVKNGVLAASVVANPDKTLPGTVLFLNPANGALLGSVVVGANPDQLVFTPDGTKVLVANEGEIALPSTNPAGGDPEGSVSIIDVSGGFAAPTVQTARFTASNGQEYALLADGVRIFPGNTAAQDLEPEYIAISPDGTKAIVTLQEASSLAVLDIATATFTNLLPMGLKNYSRGTYDFSDRDGASNTQAIELKSGLPAFGTPMPDAISSYQAAGQTYYITSNEGDDRNDFLTTPELTTVNALNYDLDDATFPTEGTAGGSGSTGVPGTGLKGNDELGRLSVCNIPGLRGDLDGDGDVDRILSYGARGFSIHDNTGKRIFESGDLLDRIIAQYFPTQWDDARSDNKGAEAEGVAISSLFGRTYAFIGLERAHAVAVFDVTNPMAVEFTTLIHRRGDLNPESMLIIPAADSPTGNPLLLVANEVSFSLTTYELAASNAPLTLQLLHYYGESGLLGIQTAPLMGAMIDKFDDLHPTVVLGEGDSFIPGPWLIAGADPLLNTVPGIGATALARPDIAIMNAFNTTASALGNHEFDLGSPVLQGAIAAGGAWPGAQFPLITANLNFASDSALRALADSSSGGSGGAAASGTQVPNVYRGEEVSGIKGKIAPYAVHTVQGQRIGFVGATTWELLTKSSPNGTRPLNDNNPATSELQEVATAVQGAVDLLKARGINKIIMLDQLDALQRNKDLAPLLTGVDVMVAGGGHERMGDANDTAIGFNGHDADFIPDAYPIMTAGADGKPVLIVTTDTEYSYLGRLVVNFDAAGEIITGDLNTLVNGAYAAAPSIVEAVYNNGQTAAQIVAASPMATKVKAIVDALNTVIVSKDGTIHGHTKVYLEGDRVFGRAQEVNLGNLTADANAVKARNALGLPATAAVVSLKNGGGLRASIGSVGANGAKLPPASNAITNKPQGAISQLDTENALRFDNKLIVFDTNPAGLMAILEFTAGLASGNGGFPQVGNIRFSFDKTATPKVRNVVLMNDAGAPVAKIAENGVVLPSAPALIQVVTLNFMANGGDSYPIKYLDPAATPPNQIPNPNTSNFRFLLNNGTLSAEIARNLDFTTTANVPATALGEQKAFTDYITARHGSPVTAYDAADTPIAQDTRIQQLPTRSLDTVLFTEIELWRQMFFGTPNGDDLRANEADFDGDGKSNLMEFAFGTLPGDNSSGVPELIYTGTFAGNGTISLRGQPITGVQPIPNSVDFRYLFMRRKNHEAAGLVYTPQFSADMQNWQASSATPTILADDGAYQIVSVPYTRFISGRKARFARLLVTAP